MKATEELLVAQTLAGDTRAFAQLIQRHRPWVQRKAWASAHQREEAEDLVQDIFCRALEQLPHLRDPARFGPWLGSIATRIIASHWRQRECWQRIATEIAARHAPEPELPDQLCEKRDLQRSLQQGLAQMPKAHRRALLLYYFEYLNSNELAPLLGLSPAGAKDHLNKGRQYLRRHLKKLESHYARR
jgi:RNA polymerase sigma-70 factor (ECF subfamily)